MKKDSIYVIHNSENFQFRLIKRDGIELIWQVELVAGKATADIFGTIELNCDVEYAFYCTLSNRGLSVEWMKELSNFLELVNKEQNGISEASQAPTKA